MIAKERLYLTADRKEVVKEGDPRAAFLLIAPGQYMSDSDAKRYGLLPEGEVKELKPVQTKEFKTGETKNLTREDVEEAVKKASGLTITYLPTGGDKT